MRNPEPRNQTENGGARTGGGISVLANTVFFILACISAYNANKTMVYDACGPSLRNIVISDIVMNVGFFITACCCGSAMLACAQASTTAQIIATVLALLYTIAAICLSALSLEYSVAAHDNKNCTDVLSSRDGGFDSPSANTGSPLLMIIGYIYGSLYAITSFVFLIATCCLAGVCYAHHH